MYQHPDIQEACVIGTRDEKRGETVKALVVLAPGREGRVSAEDIIEWWLATPPWHNGRVALCPMAELGNPPDENDGQHDDYDEGQAACTLICLRLRLVDIDDLRRGWRRWEQRSQDQGAGDDEAHMSSEKSPRAWRSSTRRT